MPDYEWKRLLRRFGSRRRRIRRTRRIIRSSSCSQNSKTAGVVARCTKSLTVITALVGLFTLLQAIFAFLTGTGLHNENQADELIAAPEIQCPIAL